MTRELRCSCDSLWKTYARRPVLRGCSLRVGSGEMVGLVGENGSGKSTLVRCLLGFTAPSMGSLWVHPSVGYCPQNNYLNDRLTLREHLQLMTDIYRQDHSPEAEYLERLIDTLHLNPYLPEQIGHLSSGTYQKAKFVSSVLHRPAVIILDEPCDGFDWAMYQAFWDIMSALTTGGAAMLMISHLLYDRGRFDRIYELREGTCEHIA